MKNDNLLVTLRILSLQFLCVYMFFAAIPMITAKAYTDIPKIEIRSNKISKYKVAMSCNGNDESINRTIYSIAMNDLSVTKLFDIYTQTDQQGNNKNTGMEFKCSLEITEEYDEIEVRIKIQDLTRFHNASSTSSNEREFVVEGPKNSMHLIAHKVANHIFKAITNMEGLFDTKIVYVEDTTKATTRKERYKNETNINYNTSTKLAQIDFGGSNHSYIIQSSDNGIVLSPRYSHDNKKIAYVAFDRKSKNDKEKVFNIYIYDVKKKKSIMVINNSITKALAKYCNGKVPQMSYAPRFSHDGNSIVFAMASEGTSAIYSYDFNNKKIVILTKHRYNNKRAIDTSPCYLRDNKGRDNGIIFTSDKYGIEQIFTISIDGKNEKRLTYRGGKYSQPVCSPKGDLIAYTKQQNNQFYICTMDINSCTEKELVSGYLVEEPCFSPDGRYIAFTYAPSSTSHSRIAVVDITGRHMFILRTPDNKSCSSPAWSNSYEI